MFAKLSSKPSGAGAEGADSPYTKHEASAVSDTTSAGTSSTGSEAGSTVASTESPEDESTPKSGGADNKERPAEAPAETEERPAETAAASEPAAAAEEQGAAQDEPGDSRGRREKQPPSHCADAQAHRRAAKRYQEDTNGCWVKGKPGAYGASWIPEVGAQTFRDLQAALEYERQKTQLRRCTWANLRGQVAATRGAVSAEAIETRKTVAEEAKATRRDIACTREDIASAREALSSQIQEGMGKVLGSQRPRQTSGASQLAYARIMENVSSAALLGYEIRSRGPSRSSQIHNIGNISTPLLLKYRPPNRSNAQGCASP